MVLWPPVKSTAQVWQPDEEAIHVDYSDRLHFYVQQLSKDYLREMAAKEKLLLQMIRNASAEIKSRGIAAIFRDDPDFGPLYRNLDGLIVEYDQELEQVLDLISQVSDLKNVMEREKRYGMADLFSALKDSLVRAIDNRDLQKLLPSTKTDRVEMLQEYSLELDSLVTYYGKLARYERRLDPAQDKALLERVKLQKEKIAGYLTMRSTGRDSAAAKLTDAYVDEANQLVDLLSEITAVQKDALQKNPQILSEIETLKRDYLSRVDRRVLELIGYDDYALPDGARISDIFKEWRITRLAAYQAKYYEYQIMKQSLINSADEAQRARMLQRDLSDALLNYVDEAYELAEMQLEKIIDDYGAYYGRMDAVYFYRAESQYARLLYDQAYKGYEALLARSPRNQYVEGIYLRLITLAQFLDREEDFFKWYGEFVKIENEVSPKVASRVHYLAGYYSLIKGKARDAETYLAKIRKGSKYYLPGLYLAGIALARRSSYEGAVRVFKTIIGMNNLPWTDPNLAIIRNNSLLRLGFIYYERGEYEQALAYFNKVSKGVDARDKVLIGTAWARLKAGDYEKTIDSVNELFQSFLSSNYTYEALVLAAHCKRLLNQPEDALDDLRYVAKARGVLELANEYNDERRRMLQQLDELENMEETVLDAQSRSMYEMISEIKFSLKEQLVNLGYQGGMGSTLLDEFDSERQQIYRQIRELDTIIESASKVGNQAVAAEARENRERLIRTLVAYQSDKMIRGMNYFFDFPLATKESSTKYRRQVVQNLVRDMEVEKQRISQDLARMHQLAAANGRVGSAVEIAALKADLKELEDRADRFQAWLSTYNVEEIQTDFDHWADFSGFGMSDITMQELEKRDTRIVEFSRNLNSIDALMQRRKSELETRLSRFDAELDKIRKELEAEQLRLEKMEKEKFFENLYFDTSISEVKG